MTTQHSRCCNAAVTHVMQSPFTGNSMLGNFCDVCGKPCDLLPTEAAMTAVPTPEDAAFLARQAAKADRMAGRFEVILKCLNAGYGEGTAIMRTEQEVIDFLKVFTKGTWETVSAGTPISDAPGGVAGNTTEAHTGDVGAGGIAPASDTPRTDAAFEGDHSVGLMPEVSTWARAKAFARQLELQLTASLAGHKLAYDALVAANTRAAELEKELTTMTDECRRQMRYGIRQHEIAQEKMRELTAANARAAELLASQGRERAYKHGLECIERGCLDTYWAGQARKFLALVIDPPPVVPKAVADALAEALREVDLHHGVSFSGTTRNEVEKAFATYQESTK